MRKMKDSGIEWIGKIPEDWNIVKVKQIFNIGRGRVISKFELDDNGEYPVYSSQTKNNGCLGYIKSFDYDTDQLTWTTDGANAGTIFLRKGKHNCTNVCGTLSPKQNDYNLNYLKYDLDYIAFFHKRADTNGFKIMNNEMADINILFPPIEEQKLIANYLDSKIFKIDNIISKTKETIEEYKKYKQSVITEAVTKGLNPNVEMKDSGIEWIGEIPKEWKILKLKFLGNTKSGLGNKKPSDFGYGYPFVTYKNVYKNMELDTNIIDLVNSTDEERVNFNVKRGDAFFTGSSETIEELGFSSVCMNTIQDATFNGFTIRFRPYNLERYYPEFMKYYFRSNAVRVYINQTDNSVTRANLSQKVLKSMNIILPTIEEQKLIANYLDSKIFKIDKLISKKQNLITELEQYKKSLIYECVTGKREVK